MTRIFWVFMSDENSEDDITISRLRLSISIALDV